MPSEASVMPNWQADRYSLRSSSCVERRGERAAPPAGQLLEPRAPRADERELGRHEEPVREDEQDDRDEQQARSSPARPVSRYFEEGRRARAGSREASSGQGAQRSVDRRRQREVRLGQPPCAWLVTDSRTLFQPWTRMSGWWLAASAAPPRG